MEPSDQVWNVLELDLRGWENRVQSSPSETGRRQGLNETRGVRRLTVTDEAQCSSSESVQVRSLNETGETRSLTGADGAQSPGPEIGEFQSFIASDRELGLSETSEVQRFRSEVEQDQSSISEAELKPSCVQLLRYLKYRHHNKEATSQTQTGTLLSPLNQHRQTLMQRTLWEYKHRSL